MARPQVTGQGEPKMRKMQLKDYLEVNKLLDTIEKYSTVHWNNVYQDKFHDPLLKNCSLSYHSYVKFNPVTVEISTSYGYINKPCTYYFNRNDTEAYLIKGSEEYGLFKRCCKEYLPDYSQDKFSIKRLGKHENKFDNKQSGILMYNEKYNGIKDLHVYQYDLNSAYASIIYNKWLDTRKPMYDHILEENEHGFIILDKLYLVTDVGARVDIAFPVIDTPDSIKRYCDRWYAKKSNPKDDKEKIRAKHQLTDSIGYLQYKNPYLRAWIVELCNRNMECLIKAYPDNWLLVNTDAIYLTKQIPLTIGNKIGQFKLQEGNLTLKGVNYTSEEFGNVLRGTYESFYDIINNRLVKKDEEEIR